MKKNDTLSQPSRTKHFWIMAALIAALFVGIMAHDINRPFYGLHSWAQASGAWAARSHVNYGYAYTKGISTWAVGNPPTENPERYLDHPQLNVLLASVAMRILGVNQWSLRLYVLILDVIALFIFLRIMRGLFDDWTALLAALIYVLFPLSGYFGLGSWPTLLGFLSMWCYLVSIEGLKDGPKPKPFHKYLLAAALFFAVQFGWHGFFFAMAIGVHYVCRCVFRKQLPDFTLLAILFFAPVLSMALNLTIMAGGYEWDFGKIRELYKWRAAKGEVAKFTWTAWAAKFWEFAETNFTLPILIGAIAYLTLGQLLLLARLEEKSMQTRRFSQFWLFLLTPLLQLFILKGCLWRHQTWERPFGPFIAIAAALAIILLADTLKKLHRLLAFAAALFLIGLFAVFCFLGTKYYYTVRWQHPEKIKMFQWLNNNIPPDKYLLSFEPFIVNQHESKGGFYRPEIAWVLDREIVHSAVAENKMINIAKILKDIEEKAATGKYPYYLVPNVPGLKPLTDYLKQRYKYKSVPEEQGQRTKDKKFLVAGMYPYLIFDLGAKPPAQQVRP